MAEEAKILEIATGGWSAGVLPELGGALAWLRLEGQDVLRTAAPGATDPLETSGFPLVPYANRIRNGRFEWRGKAYRVPLNFGDHPHALHGLGWQAEWEVAERTEGGAVLRHAHDGGPGWPWAYEAEQSIAVGRDGLSATLSVTNRADEAGPFSLGFHPYFEAPSGTLLKTRVRNAWLADESCIPERRVDGDWFGDWSDGLGVERSELLDNSFTGWEGVAEIVRPEFPFVIRLNASAELSNLHLYMPPGKPFFCAEPVGNMPDALNRADAEEGERMRVLAPGETLSVSMRISVAPK